MNVSRATVSVTLTAPGSNLPPTGIGAQFTPLRAGKYVIQVEATEPSGMTYNDTIQVEVRGASTPITYPTTTISPTTTAVP